MNIAYCISAYKDEKQLLRLITALNSNISYFFIHIDKKVNIEKFQEILRDYPNVFFLKERYYIQWGGWNQVRYQYLFLKAAVNFRIKIDRIIILTGQDYPIWSNSRIMNFFTEYPNKIMMRGINLSKLEKPSPMYELLPIYHFGRDLEIKKFQCWRIITALLRKVMQLLPIRRKREVNIDGKRCDIYQASGYFSVNREQAQFIIKKLNENSIRRYFRYCFVPEELTIPTIIFNSKYKSEAEISSDRIYKGLPHLAALHIFDYGKSIKIYTDVDYDYLLSSGKMFCRKVETCVSDKLMDMIDRYRYEEDKKETHCHIAAGGASLQGGVF